MENKSIQINWSNIKVVIFDVDGTLYDQLKLRKIMLFQLFMYYAFNPGRLYELKILRDFRLERERRSHEIVNDLESAQFDWAAQASGVSPERVRAVIEKWIYKIPLKYIKDCRYPGVEEFFDKLNERGIKTAIFSDYPTKKKITVLGLSPGCIVCSTDKNVNKLKPDPRGLFRIVETLGVTISECLFIGDRDERDGECARSAGMPFLILDRNEPDREYKFQSYQQLNANLTL